MRHVAIVSIFLVLLVDVSTADPQNPLIYTNLYRTRPVSGAAPIARPSVAVVGVPNAAVLPVDGAPVAAPVVDGKLRSLLVPEPTLYHHLSQAWRSDLRCGSKNNPNGVYERHIAPNGHVAECNPHGGKPCCSAWGFCGIGRDGNGHDHCGCNTCEDYRHHGHGHSTVKWRPDGRCGAKVNPDGEFHEFVLKNGRVAECDPNSSDPCCSSYGWCGKGTDSRGYSYCTCSKCEDYRKWQG